MQVNIPYMDPMGLDNLMFTHWNHWFPTIILPILPGQCALSASRGRRFSTACRGRDRTLHIGVEVPLAEEFANVFILGGWGKGIHSKSSPWILKKTHSEGSYLFYNFTKHCISIRNWRSLSKYGLICLWFLVLCIEDNRHWATWWSDK